MVANNLKQLENNIRKEMNKAMKVVQKKALEAMYEETGGFYTGGEPKMYERTGALGDTPNTTALSNNGNEVSFQAYLDTNHQYTTGSNPNMLQVLNLANSGESFTTSGGGSARPVVGKQGFWDRSEKKIGDILDDTMRDFFG